MENLLLIPIVVHELNSVVMLLDLAINSRLDWEWGGGGGGGGGGSNDLCVG